MRKLVAAVVYRKDGRFLLLKRKLNWKGWEFVKGQVEKEPMKKAVLREVREETGLRKAKIICKLPVEVIYHHRSMHGHRTSTQSGFLVEYPGGRIRLSPEHSSYRWADRKRAEKLLTYVTHKTFLRLADRHIRETESEAKKRLMEGLSRRHITHLSFDGKTIRLRYDGRMLRNRAVKRSVRVVGDWSRKKNIVYYDRNLDEPGVLPILIHEVVERHVALKYGLDVDREAHKVATAVEKEFIADRGWIKQQKIVTRAWVRANRRKVGTAKFY